ncbi:flavin reductase family protein [Nonomuraea sediminis]|uniref:flavin reductase family protein n=1 Tax=Nonomuraea sediminis TaxID=2835864 RepID=UPI001BDC1DB1|nr:flavin reductase family protein [Nonomuraea sediminis]
MAARAFRDLFGRLPTGVCVITTAGPAGTSGMTASSVCSVSLNPLLLLVCIANDSGTLRAIRGNQHFAVNLLHAGQAEVSRAFATRHRGRLAAVDHELVDRSPVLRQAMGWLTCRLYDAIPCGDHTIVVGEVLSLDDRQADPLVWHRGGYHRMAA